LRGIASGVALSDDRRVEDRGAHRLGGDTNPGSPWRG